MQIPEQPQEEGLEQDQEEEHRLPAARKTMDGSVDWHGNPCLKNKSGGWLAGSLILREFQNYSLLPIYYI
jgi:hypothetical protein